MRVISGIGAPAWPAYSRPANVWVPLLLALGVTSFHLMHGLPLAHSVLLQSFNWVFDYDSSRFVGGWCTAGAPVSADLDTAYVPRHILSLAVRPVCLLIAQATEGDARQALMTWTALVAGCNAALAYLLASTVCAHEFDRVLLTGIYTVSTHGLLQGVIPETFGLAMAGVGLHLALLLHRRGRALGTGWAARVSLFLNLGCTVTNGALNLLSSAVLSCGRISVRSWLRAELRTWLAVVVALAATAGLCAWLLAPDLLTEVHRAPRQLWWVVNIYRGEPASVWQVIVSFMLYGFVAPVATIVNLPPPDGHAMMDFRALHYSAPGWAAAAAWLSAATGSAMLLWQRRTERRLLLVLMAWLLANIVLHSYWQYRGSVFMYGPHTTFAGYALVALGYGRAMNRLPHAGLRALGLALLSLTAANNYARYLELVKFLLAQAPAH